MLGETIPHLKEYAKLKFWHSNIPTLSGCTGWWTQGEKMRNNTRIGVGLVASALISGVVIGYILESLPVVSAQSNHPVFELRTYTANDGQLDGMVKELEFASRIFERHGMENVGYWVPTDSPLSENTLIYILKHESRDAAGASWDSFRKDWEWRAGFEEFNREGRLVAGVESVFMRATDFSAFK